MPTTNQPSVMKLEPGDYFWCACGKTDSPPFCDGSHKGTEIRPQKLTIEETKTIALCNCKQSKNPPFCDGSHTNISI